MTYLIFLIDRYWRSVSVLCLVVITALSLSPLPELPPMGGDKLHHFIAYAGLALPVSISAYRRWPSVLAFFVAWSAAIELIQPFVNRYGEWLDLLANSIGVLIGLLVGKLLKRCLLKSFDS